MQGLDVDLHFERGELRSAQKQDDTETGEVEKKNEQSGGKHRRAQQRKRDMRPHAQAVRAEDAGGLRESRVEVSQRIPDDANDNGGVVKNMREQYRSQRAGELKRRLREEKRQPTVRTKQGIEARDDDRGKHERDGGDRPQNGFAGKVESSEQKSRRETEQEGEQGGEKRLIKRKTKNEKSALEMRRSKNRCVNAENEDAREGKEKKDREE